MKYIFVRIYMVVGMFTLKFDRMGHAWSLQGDGDDRELVYLVMN